MTKSEYRNPKSETMTEFSKFKCSKPNQTWSKLFGNLNFCHLNLFRISNFGFWIFSLSLICLSIFSVPVSAQTARGFKVSPPTLKYELNPGQKTEKIIKVTNQSNQALEFVANTEDFVVTNNNGIPELLPEGTLSDKKFSGSTWAAIIPDSFTVAPGQSFTTTLYLQVPGDARPGGRYFSVAFKPVNGNGPSETGAAVNTVIGTLVYLTVKGPIEENAQISLFTAPKLSEFGPIEFTTEINNLGDMHISPKATVQVKDIFGREVYHFALDNLNIFPGVSRTYTNTWQKKWLLGPFKAEITGTYGQNNNLTLLALTSFWVIPYRLILIILLAIVIGFVGFRYFSKKQEPVEVKEEKAEAK